MKAPALESAMALPSELTKAVEWVLESATRMVLASALESVAE